MRDVDRFSQVWLHRDPVDMRKSIDGLSSIVLDQMSLDFTEERLFVFIGRCGRKLKLLYWDRSGFALWYKRLERQRFCWPKGHEQVSIASGPDRLRSLLEGFDAFQRPHEILRYSRIG